MTVPRFVVALALALPVVPTLLHARDLEGPRGGTARALGDAGPSRATRAETGTQEDVARYAARDAASRDLENFTGGIGFLGVVLVVVIVIAVLALIQILVQW